MAVLCQQAALVISCLASHDSPMQYSLFERSQEHNPVLTYASAAFRDGELSDEFIRGHMEGIRSCRSHSAR